MNAHDRPSAMAFGPHHDGSALYVGSGRPQLGERVPVRIRIPADDPVEVVRVRTVQDGEPAFAVATRDQMVGDEQWFTGEVLVHNPVTGYRFQLDRGAAGYSWVNGLGEHHRDIPDAFDFRLTTHDPGPDWVLDTVVYQVFPDRFAHAGPDHPTPAWAVAADWDTAVEFRNRETPQQFYGGDLDGITAHLDHLRALGIGTLYLTPIFPAMSNHRYNATSFDHVDPLLGGDEALVRLSDAVHAAGIRLVGDLTTNHSGDDHAWFQAAVADPDSVERGFYYMEPNGEYVSWLGFTTLPKFDLASEALRDRMFGTGNSVLARWLRPPYSFDGWRIDVANMTGRYAGHDHNAAVAREIRATVDAVGSEPVLIGEYTNDYTADLTGDGWQGSMNYVGFSRPVWSWLMGAEYTDFLSGHPFRMSRRPGTAAVAGMREFLAGVPWSVAARHWNLLSSHDSARVRTVVGSAELVEVAAVLLFGYLGTPMMFAGDEWGLEGLNGEDSRRPMPWDAPDRRDESLFAVYRELIALRSTHPALRHGGVRWAVQDDEAIGFLRETTDERLLVLATRGPWSGTVLPASLAPTGVVETIYGAVDLSVSPAGIAVPGDGPGAHLWRLS